MNSFFPTARFFYNDIHEGKGKTFCYGCQETHAILGMKYNPCIKDDCEPCVIRREVHEQTGRSTTRDTIGAIKRYENPIDFYSQFLCQNTLIDGTKCKHKLTGIICKMCEICAQCRKRHGNGQSCQPESYSYRFWRQAYDRDAYICSYESCNTIGDCNDCQGCRSHCSCSNRVLPIHRPRQPFLNSDEGLNNRNSISCGCETNDPCQNCNACTDCCSCTYCEGGEHRFNDGDISFCESCYSCSNHCEC